jgi:stearoyl-CoA desaturase (Delta-9 desaturase)
MLDLLLRVLLGTIVGLLLAQMATWATSVYLHRTLSHRALELRGGAGFGFRVLIWLTTGVKPREWVAVHRKHHAHTDVDGDPHSPVLLGWVRVEFTNAALYRKVARDPEQVERYARDLPRDRWDRALFDHGWLGLAIGIAAMVWLIGPVAGLTAAVVHAGSYLLMNAAVNAIAHTFGRQPYGNTATNLQWLAWLTGGEGLHNNHHEAPTSARFAHRRGEFDPSWWSIKLLSWSRLATIRHRGPLPKPTRRDLVGAGTPS